MRRIMVLLIVVALFCTCIPAYGENEEATYFSTTMLKVLDYNAKEWMSDESNRALFTALAFADYGVQDNIPYSLSDLGNGTICIGREAFVLTVAYNERNNNKSLMILFDTRDITRAAYVVLSLNKEELDLVMRLANTDGYYKVDIVDLKEMIDALEELLSKYV